MLSKIGRAAAIAALLFHGTFAVAQDVTLVAREGNIVLSGSLQGFDGEFYRIDTAYGQLTVDAEGVICEGPACPELTAPKATIRIVGPAEMGNRLLPGLFSAFAAKRGLIYEATPGPDYAAVILDPESQKELAEISFRTVQPAQGLKALAEGDADLQLSSTPVDPFGSRAVALDALVPIVAPDNPTPEVSTVELAAALSGEATNWAELGGPDMPLVLH
ncbi:MAG: substrate-binding domain-containing protein, partial [Tabrizicola sp.]